MSSAAEVLSLLLLTQIIPGGQPGAQPVAALLRHSEELSYPDQSLLIVDVVWKFQAQNKIIIKIVMYHKGQISFYDPQFTDRVDVSNNGTKLRIKDLRMEDTGVYTAEMTFTNNEIHQVSYNLTVYEPVPSPQISQVVENTRDQCNVTLRCSVSSNTSDFFYTWKYRHQDSEYWSYKNGSKIQISLPPDDHDLLCIVQNPVDQKNVSTIVQSCSSTNQPRHWYILSIIPLFIILTSGVIYRTWKIRRKRTQIDYYTPESQSTEPSTSISQILPYDQVPLRSNPPTQEFKTLYTCLESKT